MQGKDAPRNKVEAFIAELRSGDMARGQVAFHKLIPERQARYEALARPLPRPLQDLLGHAGIDRLFSHQARAMDLVRDGKNVVVATPTASGKTLIYNIPFLETVLSDPAAKALYLFPLKALAQDQLKTFNAMASLCPEPAPEAAIYDGDTPSGVRTRIRKSPPAALFTNPEMLHLSLLAHHHSWASFFAGLKLVVVDEMHTYRGIMGSHMAWVFARLRRICRAYGANPVFILCSATIGNPGPLASALTGLPVTVVTESGAPAGPRHMLFLNPLDDRSTMTTRLLREALSRGLRTLVYAQSRKLTELLALWAQSRAGDYADRIAAYRAGYLPEERRDIERRLSEGSLLAVISTSALELGIDIGGLDLCILVGYPGTIMAATQRGGRVGRDLSDSAVLLVAGEDALDQYFMSHPEEFFTRPVENAAVNPKNPVIAARHLSCAAAEMALSLDDPLLVREGAGELAREMARDGSLLLDAGGATYYSPRKTPHRDVDLRGAGDRFRIVEKKEDPEGGKPKIRTLGEIDGLRVYRETHPGAVYLHQQRTFLVDELDIPGRTAYVSRAKVDYYTRPRVAKQTEILAVEAERPVLGTRVSLARLRVTEKVESFEKKNVRSGKSMGVFDLDLPENVFETQGIYFEIPRAVETATVDRRLHFMGGIHAFEHAAIGMMPLLVLTDRNDLGGISTPFHPQVGQAAVFIYDAMSGGAGLCAEAFHKAEDLISATLDAIARCPCELGCPSCVHSPKCGSGNRPIDKEAALLVLRLLRDPALAPPPPPRPALPDFGKGPSGAFRSLVSRSAAPGPLPDNRAEGNRGIAASRPATRPTAIENPRAPQAPPADVAPPSEVSVPRPSPAPPPRPRPGRYGVLDIETRRGADEVGGWHKASDMGVSVAVLYDSGPGSFTPFFEHEVPALVEQLRKLDLVIGFNILRFDYAVLSGLSDFAFHRLPTLDMLREIHQTLGYRLSLDSLAKATLDSRKTADGLTALRWWKEQRITELISYCTADVAITRDLYLYGREHGHLLFTNKAGHKVRVPVKW
ncbi:MAG: DEAD/DEAH box helicase [Thermodesulfobacteriota bacterium]